MSKTQKASDKKEKEYNATKEAHKAEADRVEKQEEFLQTLATGISANEGNGNGFAEQLEAANSEKTEANTAAEKAKQRIAFLKDQIKSKQSQVKEAEKENAELSKQFKSMQTEIEQLKVQRMEIEYDPNMETEMKKRRAKKQQEMDKIQQASFSIGNYLTVYYVSLFRKSIFCLDSCPIWIFHFQIHIRNSIAPKSRDWWRN